MRASLTIATYNASCFINDHRLAFEGHFRPAFLELARVLKLEWNRNATALIDVAPLPTGHEAMLEFGQALVNGARTFTFPHARNLKQTLGFLRNSPLLPSEAATKEESG